MSRSRISIAAATAINASATLASRVLGMLRDVLTVAMFGIGTSIVLDVFILAFRIPNLLRRMLGEGILAIRFMPILSQALVEDAQNSQNSHYDGRYTRSEQLLTRTLATVSFWTGLTSVIMAVVLAGYLIFEQCFDGRADAKVLFAGLFLTMVPYLFFIVLTAYLAATLQGLKKFTAPAVGPIVMNLLWIAVVLWIAPMYTSPVHQTYWIAATISVAAVVQLLIMTVVLHLHGFHLLSGGLRGTDTTVPETTVPETKVTDTKVSETKVTDTTVPDRKVPETSAETVISRGSLSTFWSWLAMAVGLTGVSICVIIDSAVAWYWCSPGMVSRIFMAERLFEFPMGLFGISTAISAYPAMNLHAARGNFQALRDDLLESCRIATFWGIPSSFGMFLIAVPLSMLLFDHGNTTSIQAAEIGTVLAGYSAGIWAWCVLPILVRAFYAKGEYRFPAAATVVLCMTNIFFDWFFPDYFALSTVVLTTLLALLFCRRLEIPVIRLAALPILTSIVMILAGYGMLQISIADVFSLSGTLGELAQLTAVCFVCAIAYISVYAGVSVCILVCISAGMKLLGRG